MTLLTDTMLTVGSAVVEALDEEPVTVRTATRPLPTDIDTFVRGYEDVWSCGSPSLPGTVVG